MGEEAARRRLAVRIHPLHAFDVFYLIVTGLYCVMARPEKGGVKSGCANPMYERDNRSGLHPKNADAR